MRLQGKHHETTYLLCLFSWSPTPSSSVFRSFTLAMLSRQLQAAHIRSICSGVTFPALVVKSQLVEGKQLRANS